MLIYRFIECEFCEVFPLSNRASYSYLMRYLTLCSNKITRCEWFKTYDRSNRNSRMCSVHFEQEMIGSIWFSDHN